MAKLKQKVLALAMTALTAGCVALEPPAPPLPDPAVPTQWPVSVEETGLPARAAPDIGWREFFHDPKLQTLIARSLANNRDLRVAILNIDKARAQYRSQRAGQWPWVGGSVGSEHIGGEVPSSNQYSATVGVTGFELDLFGRARTLTDIALQQYFAQEATRRSAEIVLVADIATLYLTLAIDQELSRLSQAKLKNYQESASLIEKRFSLGAVSGLDVEQIHTQVESARVDVARYDGQILRDINALILLVGAPVEPAVLPVRPDDPIAGFVAPPPGLPSETLLRRPDIQAAEHRLRAANANIGAARAAYFPSISLTGSVGSASTELFDLFGKGSWMWSFIPKVTVPIFQAGRLEANMANAVADRDIALAQYEKAIQTGFREVTDALASAGTLVRQYDAQTALVDAATRAEQLSRLRYQAGRDSYLVLLDAQRTLYGAQQALLATYLAAQINRVTLYKVLGGGWTEGDG
ncbi:putative outer membrane protein oprM precursor [Candidatus Competibacter denitrificans Run_A_D11]|uniref:Outer membrane protein oprM n=1 Tax=Candidatus Competibacter denitrificans Run_A_D11 TaxID=1400863 RepID=W6MD64_9GAMM|nr:efflux transporter outer membrane subunit [Candidatus Competibacter denitrificans]CDI02513.1 putative outer membrane protein oprM precursor [Candidatus Competibacter denitrificans Run_A_D11]HCK81886.1 transporter [Candidatus Competibacteraceae bacterium]